MKGLSFLPVHQSIYLSPLITRRGKSPILMWEVSINLRTWGGVYQRHRGKGGR